MRNRWDTGRVEAFSDGVFAIAITLLILEISVPESGFEHLWKGIADQWPSYLAYATSFLTVGGLGSPPRIFHLLASADSRRHAPQHPPADARLLPALPDQTDRRGDPHSPPPSGRR